MKNSLLLITTILLLSACSFNFTKEPEEENNIAEAEQQVSIAYGVMLEDLSDSYVKNIVSNTAEKIAEEEMMANNPYAHIPPDESGKVIIVMFHNFVPEYEGGDRKITTTLAEFRLLLERLYNSGYRSASLSDFIDGSINVQRGAKPIIFTFDDGKPSQFSFIKNEDGTLSENPNTAVAVMEQFYEEFPDFGLNGTFFVNFGFAGTFGTAGTIDERVNAMIDKGFDIKNHTYNHANLSILTTPEQIMEEVGKNAKTLYEINPNHVMDILALPFGNNNKALAEYIKKGTYDGYAYENRGVMLVGAEPAIQLYTKDADPARIRRVLASGMDPIECDLAWWLDNLRDTRIFISDGDPDTISIPAKYMENIDEERIKALNKKLVILEDAEEEPGEQGGETPVNEG